MSDIILTHRDLTLRYHLQLHQNRVFRFDFRTQELRPRIFVFLCFRSSNGSLTGGGVLLVAAGGMLRGLLLLDTSSLNKLRRIYSLS